MNRPQLLTRVGVSGGGVFGAESLVLCLTCYMLKDFPLIVNCSLLTSLHAPCPSALSLPQEFEAVLSEWDVGLRFGQCVRPEFRALEMFQIDHVSVDLLDHVVDACQEVLASLVIA